MNPHRLAAALAGATLLSSSLWGADTPPRGGHVSAVVATQATAPQTIVVLDVARVFKNHVRFKQRMDAIRQSVEDHDKKMSAAHQEIMGRRAKLKDFKSGSMEYKKIEDQAAHELSELRISAVSRKSEIFDREGKIYFETYQEIVAAVALLATQHNISLVLSYSSDETDPLDRGSILKAINREVVYQKRLDITNLVISHVNGVTVAVQTEPGRTRQ